MGIKGKVYLEAEREAYGRRNRKIISLGNGVELKIGGERIFLDPKKATCTSFVSHAHTDHCPRSFSGEVLTHAHNLTLFRKAPARLDSLVPCSYGQRIERDKISFTLLNSGHVLGSSQLMIENDFTLVYTGDLNVDGGFTTGMAEVEECDVLIIESTFGSPEYAFPTKREVVKEISDWASDCLKKGTIPVLFGYALGKAQELTCALSSEFKILVDDGIYEMNQRYASLGVELGEYGRLEDMQCQDALIITSPSKKNREFLQGIGPCSTGVATGWAADGWRWKRYGAERGFALSDHSDFNGLLRYVEKANPQVVYTLHGFAQEFSEELRERGFYSEPLC